MKLPRVPCTRCGRDTAAAPVAGSLSKGSLWRHDDPSARRDPDGSLVSCGGSLEIVDLPQPAQQLEFDAEDPQPQDDHSTPALFVI